MGKLMKTCSLIGRAGRYRLIRKGEKNSRVQLISDSAGDSFTISTADLSDVRNESNIQQRGFNIAGIFDGFGPIVDDWLGIKGQWGGRPLHYWHKKSLNTLLAAPPRHLDGPALTRRLLCKMTKTYEDVPACERKVRGAINWKLRKQTVRSNRNDSPETILERRIADATDDRWANQVPTASGLLGTGGRSAVDLVCCQHPDYSLIELKWMSDTPIYAAFEILGYGLVYLFSRLHQSELGYDGREIFAANHVSLLVLAPQPYYCGESSHLDWLAGPISAGLAHVTNDCSAPKLTMDFRFEALPDGFDYAATTECEMLKCLRALTEKCEPC
jgi:hypothetical protein